MHLHGTFVTGTDTDVGKTFAVAALVAALRADGVDAIPVKPVQTGDPHPGAARPGPDIAAVAALAGLPHPPAELARWSFYRYRPPCSPHLAARLARRPIGIPRIVRQCEQLARRHEFLVVEGAGGVLVPLSPRTTMLDLMRALALPVTLVARPGLGTLNHTLLSIEVLRRANLDVSRVLVCRALPGRPTAIERDNIDTIRRRAHALVVVLPFFPGVSPSPGNQPDAKAFHRYARRCLSGIARPRRCGSAPRKRSAQDTGSPCTCRA